MSLSHLARRVCVPRLLRASGPRFSPAPGARHLSYRSFHYQDKELCAEIEAMLKRSKTSYEENCRLFKILEEDADRAIRMFNEEWEAYQKVVRRNLQDSARFRKNVDKILDGALVVSVGAFAAALGLFEILEEDLDRAIRMCNEEWDALEKVMRRNLQDSARFRKNSVKILDGALVVSVGAFAAALGWRCHNSMT